MRWSRIFPILSVSSVLLVAGCASSGVGSQPAASAAEPAAPPAPAAASAASPSSPAAAFYEDEAAQTRASQLFRAVCTGYCHTTEGAGREAPDLFDCESDHGGSDQEIFDVITAGLPDTQMQAFGGKLPDEDLWRIVAYLRVNSTC